MRGKGKRKYNSLHGWAGGEDRVPMTAENDHVRAGQSLCRRVTHRCITRTTNVSNNPIHNGSAISSRWMPSTTMPIATPTPAAPKIPRLPRLLIRPRSCPCFRSRVPAAPVSPVLPPLRAGPAPHHTASLGRTPWFLLARRGPTVVCESSVTP